MADRNGTFTVFPEDSRTGSTSPADQLTEAVYMLAHRLEKSEKKRKKLDKRIDKLLKPGKKSKKTKGKGKKHKKGKGRKKYNRYDDILHESAASARKIVEMYAESRFFPDGRSNPKK